MKRGLLGALLLLVGCATAPLQPAGRLPSGIEVLRLPLQLSSAYLIKSSQPFLIDAGSSGEGPRMVALLQQAGLRVADLQGVLVTHGHCDHGGGAAELQRLGAPIWLGAGDVKMAKAGHNDELKPTRFSARLIHLTFSDACTPFTPDVEVTRAPRSLASWGVDAEVFQLPGHTPGSLVVVVDRTVAFVGDVLMGGSLGGKFSPTEPHEHYFQADREQNRRNLQWLIDRGIQVFYLGHGGPVKREDVISEFKLHQAP